MLSDRREEVNYDNNLSDMTSEQESDEESILIDEQTLNAIVKFQALVRGYLTRKLIYEHL